MNWEVAHSVFPVFLFSCCNMLCVSLVHIGTRLYTQVLSALLKLKSLSDEKLGTPNLRRLKHDLMVLLRGLFKRNPLKFSSMQQVRICQLTGIIGPEETEVPHKVLFAMTLLRKETP